jgi:hypothetical protein
MKKTKKKNVLQSLSEMRKKPFFLIVTLLATLVLVLTVILPLWRLFPEVQDRSAIPLHYNIYFGVDQFGPWERLFTIPILGCIILIINTIIAIVIWPRDRVLSYAFSGVSLIAQIFLLLAMIFVTLINLSYA